MTGVDPPSVLLEEFLESLELVDEPAESSWLSLLRMTDEDDVAELSMMLSLELERKFPLEEKMTEDELVSAEITEEDDAVKLSSGFAKLGDEASEHASKQTISAAATNL